MRSPREWRAKHEGGGTGSGPPDETLRDAPPPAAAALAATVAAGGPPRAVGAPGSRPAATVAAGGPPRAAGATGSRPAATVIRGSAPTPTGAPERESAAGPRGAGAALSGATLGRAATVTAQARTTVLPHVTIVDDKPTLVHEDRLRYEHEGRLGQGGVGEVLKTRDHDIGRVVAVKRLRPDVRDTGAVIRFIDEIRTVGQLEHPNIVPIHDVGVDAEGEHFFVMKYIAGETLESIIQKLAAGDPEYHRRYPFERRVDLFTQICEAVRYAHAQGIIHRDLKPANVMVGPFGEVVVMDWGLAKRIRRTATGHVDPAPGDELPDAPPAPPTDMGLTAAGSLLGTPAYMAPEQARGQPADERSDVYSLCVLFYELLTLRYYLGEKKTWAEALAAVINEAPPAASRLSHPHQPVVPMDLTWFLKAGLSKDPAGRYQSVQAMLDRLARRREGLVPIQCHVTFVKRANSEVTHFVERHPIIVTVALGLTLLTLIVLGIRALL